MKPKHNCIKTENTMFQPHFQARSNTAVVSLSSIWALWRRMTLINEFGAIDAVGCKMSQVNKFGALWRPWRSCFTPVHNLEAPDLNQNFSTQSLINLLSGALSSTSQQQVWFKPYRYVHLHQPFVMPVKVCNPCTSFPETNLLH